MLACVLLGVAPAAAIAPPAPFGPLPSDKQVDWMRLEWYAFIHFGINTFTNREWGKGNESPSLFAPSGLQADAIVTTLKKAGMKGLIYTAKHHDGFCLWHTRTTTHAVQASPWKKDVVRALSEAASRHGMLFGLYISPWDMNHAEYGRSGYVETYFEQVRELLTQYGPIFEIWFDGAQGGVGYYGGANERRDLDSAEEYYRYADLVSMIRRLQPDCIVWGAEGHGDVRWGGSEKGFVPYPHSVVSHGKWSPLEADTTINRAGWFWHPRSAAKVKSPEQLMQIYMDSVGRGANLILNIAPDRHGELDAADVASLMSFADMRRKLLSRDFALHAAAEADEVRGNDPKFAADRVTDGNIETYWCPEDETHTGTLVITLPKAATFDVVRVREQIRLGQRVTAFCIDAWLDGEWKTVDAHGATIGNQVLRRLPHPITTHRVRVRITASSACPCISEISLMRMPEAPPAPAPSSQPHTPDTLSTSGWQSLSPGGRKAWDNNPSTHWLTKNNDAKLVVDMGSKQVISGFSYLPRQDGVLDAMTDIYRFEVSQDGQVWKTVAQGMFSNIKANPIEQRIDFGSHVRARFFRFVGEHALEGSGASAAEIKIHIPTHQSQAN